MNDNIKYCSNYCPSCKFYVPFNNGKIHHCKWSRKPLVSSCSIKCKNFKQKEEEGI